MAELALANNLTLKKFHGAKSVVSRFVAKSTLRRAIIWALVFGISVISTALGYISLYSTPQSRSTIISTLGSNAGLKILFGNPYRIETIGGFIAWRSLSVLTIIGVIWAIMTSTKSFRGEEEAGRIEIFLSGLTTARRTAINILVGLTSGLLIILAVVVAATYAVGQTHGLNFSFTSSLLVGLAVIAGPAEFMAVGALLSQLAPIRRRAAMLTTAVFGVSFVVKAIADTNSSFSWLLNLTPLGWLERLHPLTDNNYWWLLPIGLFIGCLLSLTVYLAGRRDLGASLLADRDSAKPRYKLLGSPLSLAYRLQRTALACWLVGAGFVGLVYGSIAKTAVKAIGESSKGIGKELGRLTGQARLVGAETFLGIMFLLLMMVMLIMVANLVNALREDEAEGYLDNLLVRPIARWRWLSGRSLIIASMVITAALVGGLLGWVGAASTHVGVPFHKMLLGSLNVMPAAIFLMGVGLLTFSLKPRLTSLVMYGVIAWSFLLETIGPAINLNHYLLDLSILHHTALVPAVNPNWSGDIALLVLGVVMVSIGFVRFNQRDLQGA